MTDDDRVAYVTAARDAGFTDQQWRAMFYESGPYDLMFPTLALQAFVQIINERMSRRVADSAPAKRCASCSHEWTEDTVWCPKCRATGSASLICPHCGADRWKVACPSIEKGGLCRWDAAEYMRATTTVSATDSADDDEWRCALHPGCDCITGCREKALAERDAATVSARRDPAICKHGLLTTVNNCPKCSADQQGAAHE